MGRRGAGRRSLLAARFCQPRPTVWPQARMLLLAGPAAADRARTRRAAGRAVGGSAAGVEQALLPRPAAALWGPAAACAAHITFSRSQISSLTYCRPTRKLVHTLATSSRGLEMAADADLLGIGTHCDLEGCGQLDFLPFNCDCCRKTFCLVRHGGLWMPGSRPAHQGHPEPLYVKPATLSARRAAGRQQRRAAARFAWVALLARALRCARCFRRLRCACCAPSTSRPSLQLPPQPEAHAQQGLSLQLRCEGGRWQRR